MADPLSRAVFLVSGGARGITAECVTALASAHGATFLLVGRTSLSAHAALDSAAPDDALRRQIAGAISARGEKATPVAIERVFRSVRARDEITRTLARIERTGAQAHYLEADVTDGEALRRALSAAPAGPVTAIIHGAGVLADRRIEAKTAQDFAAVFATKVHGLRAMLSCVDEAKLTHLALFSSTSGFHGNVGQSDYAAANEVLNKFALAFARRYPACRTIAFDWGPWDGGMVTPFLKSLFESHGVRVMSVETGARVFVEALQHAGGSAQRLINDMGPPQPRADGAPSARPRPLVRAARSLDVEGNPFLQDHRIGGHPVLPAAFAGLWMANVCQQSQPGYRAVSVSDFAVLKGLVFDANEPARLLVETVEQEARGDGITQSVVISSAAPGQRPRYHYRAKVLLAREAPAQREPQPFALEPDERSDGSSPYESGALFHGPSFQGITRVLRADASQITVECAHPRPSLAQLGQFPPLAFDGIALDVMFQCLGLWAHTRMGVAALPTSWAQLDVLAPLPADGRFWVTAQIEHATDFALRASITLRDAQGALLAEVRGVEFTVHRPAPATAVTEPAPAPEPTPRTIAPSKPASAHVLLDARSVARALREVERPLFVVRADGRAGVTHDPQRAEQAQRRGELLAELAPTPPSRFGAASFQRAYGVRCAYMAGAMAKGIASEELVIELGRAGLLGTFGAGGLSIERIEQAARRIKRALPSEPFAFNLLHSPRKLAIEDATVDVYLRNEIRTVEASSYIDLTPSIVRYRVAGLERGPDGAVVARNRVIAKLSRIELARRFMEPPPAPIVQRLVERGLVTAAQGAMAAAVSMADDVTFEADSGGHTDNRPLVGVLSAALRLRDESFRARRALGRVRIGAAGGIGTPHAALAAFAMGADYIVTGSINQSCVEAGTSPYVKQLLASVEMTDVTMAPESDLFELGGRVQVAKLRSLFPMRAQKLYSCYQTYEGIEAIPEPVRQQLEQQIFRDTLDNVWQKAASYLAAHKPEQLERASDPKAKMALLFKWYLGQSSRWAVDGLAGRELDYQVWCGPAMGAFNAWARGTYLESPENRRVADVARVLMAEAAYLYRVQQLRLLGLGDDLFAEGAE